MSYVIDAVTIPWSSSSLNLPWESLHRWVSNQIYTTNAFFCISMLWNVIYVYNVKLWVYMENGFYRALFLFPIKTCSQGFWYSFRQRQIIIIAFRIKLPIYFIKKVYVEHEQCLQLLYSLFDVFFALWYSRLFTKHQCILSGHCNS